MTPAEEASLEAGIRAADQAMRKASTPQGKRLAFRLLADLHARRSPEMVERAMGQKVKAPADALPGQAPLC